MDEIEVTADRLFDILDAVQTGLDLLGNAPVLGEIFDVINAGIYFYNGDKLNGALSLASTIPIAGNFISGSKLLNKAVKAVKKVHGNSLKSLKPTWGYKLYTKDGKFLKNGITSQSKAEKRYSKTYMEDKKMVKELYPNRKDAYNWEAKENKVNPGPLNKNGH